MTLDREPTVAAVVPAAGESRRMGRPKLLIAFEGRPLIGRLVEKLLGGGASQVVVVAPPAETPEGPPIAEAAMNAGATVIVPENRPADMRASVELAIAELEWDEPTPDAVLLVPADSPAVGADVVSRMLEAWRADPGRIHVPTFRGRRGHPVVLPWRWAFAIAELPAGVGVNALLSDAGGHVAEVAVESESVLLDLDTPDDLERFRKGASTRTQAVRLFAVARERAGRGVVEVDLPDAATVADLRRVLAERVPALASILERVRVAVGDDYAADDAVIPPDASLAIIPPVSGG